MSHLFVPFLRPRHSISTVNQFEHVVEDKIATGAVGQKLEDLCVVHGAFFFIDLGIGSVDPMVLFCLLFSVGKSVELGGVAVERKEGKSYHEGARDHDDDAAFST